MENLKVVKVSNKPPIEEEIIEGELMEAPVCACGKILSIDVMCKPRWNYNYNAFSRALICHCPQCGKQFDIEEVFDIIGYTDRKEVQ